MKLEIQQADLQNAALINSSNLLAWGPNAFLLAYECSMIHQFGKTYVGLYCGDVGLYCGDVGLYAGEVAPPMNVGDVGL